jgi:Aromatic-ring-opening dioxygenase LigAB, LigA subunit
MSGNLSHFLVDLVSNPDQMAAYLADPERVFDQAGLTTDERDVIRSRDARRLDEVLSDGFRLQSFANNDAPVPRKAPTRKKPAVKKKPTVKKKGGRKKGGRKKGSAKKGSKR